MGRWATFDCYGTLIDWEQGLADALGRLWPDQDRGQLLATYHRHERSLEAPGPRPYREVLALATRGIAAEIGLDLAPGAEKALPSSLPHWSPFPEVADALARLRADGWRLAVLSNVDPDLLAASLRLIGVPVDMTVTVAEAGSYKPAHGHWRTFFERTGASPARHVHVAASLFHDIVPCAQLGLQAVWINRSGSVSEMIRAAELPDCAALPETLAACIPAGR